MGYAGYLTQLSQTLGNGVTTNYTYDELLRISSLGNYNYTYNVQGNITSDGVDKYSYDNLGQITGVNYDEVNIPEYNGDKIERFFYDNLGNRTSQENYTLRDITTETCTDETVVEDVTLPSGKTKTVERKQRVCQTAVTQTEKEKNTLSYTSNTLNQYTKLQNLNKNGEVKKEFTYEYDNNGNLKKDDINQYFYDYKNRLVKVLQNEVVKLDENNNIIEIIPEVEIVNYEYDVLNRRIEKTTQEETIQYIYAGQNAIEERTTNNTTNILLETRENIYSNNLDDILSTIITDEVNQTTKQYFYEKNHLGSITKITDINGNIVEQYEYDAFGVAYASVNNVEAVTEAQNNKTLSIKKAEGSETASDGNTDEITINNIRYKRYNGKGKIGNTRLYTGREYEPELKLYYNRARYYSPDLGRFISRDPIDIADDVNLYAYVGNNAVMYVDRMGLGKTLVIGFVGRTFFGYGEISKEEYRNYGIGEALYSSESTDNVDSLLYYSSATKLGSEKWDAREYIMNNIKNYDNLVIIGNSLGADNAVELSNSLYDENINVDLLITIDLQAYIDTTKVKSNTIKAINYYQTNILSSFNGDLLENNKDNTTTTIDNIKANTFCSVINCNGDTSLNEKLYHTSIDDYIYTRVISDIESIIK